MSIDPWHYPRKDLAEQILRMFESGLSTALVFFAPRRMGKTEFLCKDIMPLAVKKGWKVFYFSFLDCSGNTTNEFTAALMDFAEQSGVVSKAGGLLRKVSRVTGEAVGIKAGIEFVNARQGNKNMKEIITQLAEKNHILLLMDEVQALAQNPANAHFVASLRTALDIHKDNVKVIFTGSSQEGLRRMFSHAKAPFFHFGQNLPFPELGPDFINHLVQMFKKVTGRKIDTKMLWEIFQETQKIPQLARALVERLALNPDLSMESAKKQLLADVFEGREFANLWEDSSALERLLLAEIAKGTGVLFSIENRKRFAEMLGLASLPVPSVQSALRVLQRKGIIGQPPERGSYFIDDPNFKNWLMLLG